MTKGNVTYTYLLLGCYIARLVVIIITDFSGQPFSPIVQDKAVQEKSFSLDRLTLEGGTNRLL